MLLRDPADLWVARHEDHRVERHLGGIEELAECVEADGRLADSSTASAGRPSTNATAPSAARRKHRLNVPE